jgi:hypothetical protein
VLVCALIAIVCGKFAIPELTLEAKPQPEKLALDVLYENITDTRIDYENDEPC